MKENKQISFMLRQIKIEQFAILEENFAEKNVISLKSSLFFKVNEKEKMIGAFAGFVFEQLSKPFIKIELSCHFKIEDTSWTKLLHENEHKIILPKHFLAHLATITTGTVRGVLFAKTEGSEFNKYILPTINVTKMINEDSVFELDNDYTT